VGGQAGADQRKNSTGILPEGGLRWHPHRMTTIPPAPEPLHPLTEDWERALCVVAHPDDLEFGSAAAVARWTGQGKTVGYCMVTSGEAGIDAMDPEQCRGVREAEQIESARIVGVPEVSFLGFPDGILEYGVELRRAIALEVRRFRPEIVVTGNFRDTWGGVNLNQADHIATGKATLDAVRDAGNRWVFADQLTGGLEPWGGVQQVWAFGSPQSTHAVDTTDTFDRGVESLRAHQAYIDGLGWEHFDPAEFLEGMSRVTGQRLGVAHAAPFEVFPMGWGE
jgi:LmbE family N-acetylglucosaminyl deacetylase